MTPSMICLLLLSISGLAVSQYLTPPRSYSPANYQSEEYPQETIDPTGNIQGQYNYINPSGKSINVQYLTAKDGFKFERTQPSLPLQQNYYQQLNTKSYQPNYEQLQAYQPQEVYQNEQQYQPKFTQALFTPASEPYPAQTEGQIKSMRNYLEEEKKDLQRERQSSGKEAQAFVSVQSPNQAYSYKINY